MAINENSKFDNLELYKEYPGWFMGGRKSLRLYRTCEVDADGNITSYRWHFGYPDTLVRPVCPLLETTLYWGEQHWYETDDGYWLWWLPIVTKDKDYFPKEELNRETDWRRRSMGKVINFFTK